MKSFVLTSFLGLLLLSNNVHAACQDEPDLAVSYACFEKEYKTIDGEMNSIYQGLISAKPTDKEDAAEQKAFANKLKEAQRAWLRFRDAHVASLYPREDHDYGSMIPFCKLWVITELTRQRTEQLKAFLQVEEDDFCSNPKVYPEKSDIKSNKTPKRDAAKNRRAP